MLDGRTEQNSVVRIGKFEAEVTNNKKQRSRYYTAEANCRQTRNIARPLYDSRDSRYTMMP